MVANNSCQALLCRIQQTEFVALELNLYLNTHPCDQRAIEKFNRAYQELCELKRQYEQQCGPLMNFGFGMNNGNTWLWALQPWPWEI